MGSVLLLYNPRAGNTFFRYSLDYFAEEMQKLNYDIRLFRSSEKGSMEAYLRSCSLEQVEAVFVAGGDGSVNEAVNGLMARDSHIPVGIIPAGTDNLFSKKLGMSQDVETAIRQLTKWSMRAYDIGEVNGRYFVQSCRVGFVAALKQKVSLDMKNSMGRAAFYVKGMGQLAKTRPFTAEIHWPEQEEPKKEKLIFMEVRLPDDGKLELLGVQAGLSKIPKSLVRLKKDKEGAVHYWAEQLFVEIPQGHMAVGVDGEVGVSPPLAFQIHSKRIQFFAGEE